MNTDIVITPFIDFIHDNISKSSTNRLGPKGYPVRRFLASAEILDHQNEIVNISGLLEVIDIMKKQGGRIQGIHSNQPTGEFFDYGLVTVEDINKNEILGLWIDVEVYNDYPSQIEVLKQIDLPIGHKNRINGLSLGGTSLKGETRCDNVKCWKELKKFEGWEFSTVYDPACPIALQIEDYNADNMKKLQINTSFDNIYTKEGLTVTEAETILKNNSQNIRDKNGRFIKKCKPCDEKDKLQVNKMEGDNPKDKKTDNEEDYSDDNSDTESDDNSDTESEDITDDNNNLSEEDPMEDPLDEEPITDEDVDNLNSVGENTTSSIADVYGMSSENSDNVGAEVNVKLDRLLTALNISKTDSDIMSKLDILINKVETVKEDDKIMNEEFVMINGNKYKVEKMKPTPPEIIEQNGVKYHLVKKDNINKDIDKKLSIDDKLDAMTKTIADMQKSMTQKVIASQQNNDIIQKDKITKSEADIIGESIKKSVAQLKEIDAGYNSLSDNELEFRARMANFKKDASMNGYNMFYQ